MNGEKRNRIHDYNNGNKCDIHWQKIKNAFDEVGILFSSLLGRLPTFITKKKKERKKIAHIINPVC